MDFIIYKNSNSTDKMVDDFLLCDYLEEDTKEHLDSYNGIYLSSEDEADPVASSLKEEEPIIEKQIDDDNIVPDDNIVLSDDDNIVLSDDDNIVSDDNIVPDDNIVLSDDNIVLSDDNTMTDEQTDDEEEDDEIELQLEEFKKLILQIEEKIHVIETNNSRMITNNFFINKEQYNTNLKEISIFKNKKKDYEKNMDFIYTLLMIKNKLV